MTGVAGDVFCVLFSFFSTTFFELDTLEQNAGFAQLGTFFKVRPPLFCRFFFRVFLA